MVSKSQKKATKKYQDANYEFIKLRFKKGQKDIIKDNAKQENKSVNKYCTDKILGE